VDTISKNPTLVPVVELPLIVETSAYNALSTILYVLAPATPVFTKVLPVITLPKNSPLAVLGNYNSPTKTSYIAFSIVLIVLPEIVSFYLFLVELMPAAAYAAVLT